MEDLGMNTGFWQGKKVFLTGHTGFKGGWLSLWLQQLGAEVHGYALAPSTDPSIFEVADVASGMASSTITDIRDADALKAALAHSRPDIVFHLAAQPLVRYSYKSPVETYAVNVMGTVNLLEAIRDTKTVKAVVNVTTDKCYENREWVWPYREDEAMGGHDPYSSSKACAELITAAYRRSFFEAQGVALATARAGNVIGGGDWSEDRLIPDFLRAIDQQQPVVIRSPDAIRPWQHVLEPLCGYLLLAEYLYRKGASHSGAWNFGPADEDARIVGWIIEYMVQRMPGASWRLDDASHVHEAHTLKLDSSKARSGLRWQPRWRLEQALDRVVAWHQAWKRGQDMHAFCLAQITEYEHEVRGS
jgi:CDP-glucose 4,6-dehydratase